MKVKSVNDGQKSAMTKNGHVLHFNKEIIDLLFSIN